MKLYVACLSVGIVIALPHPVNAAPTAQHSEQRCDPDDMISLSSSDNVWIGTSKANRDLEISPREYDRLAHEVGCVPELREMVQKALADGKITFGEREEIDSQYMAFKWKRMERVINVETARARERLRAASGMSASGQDPKGLEAKPASPAPKADAQLLPQ